MLYKKISKDTSRSKSKVESVDKSQNGSVDAAGGKTKSFNPALGLAVGEKSKVKTFDRLDELKQKVSDLEAELELAKNTPGLSSDDNLISDLNKNISDLKQQLADKVEQLNDIESCLKKTEAQLSLQVEENEELSNQSYHLIKPSLIKPFEFHDRANYVSKVDSDIIEFAEELRRDGQELPISVRPLPNDPHFEYELVFGCRRHLASLVIADEEPEFLIKAFVEEISNFDAVKKMLVENENRKEIPALVRYINAEKVISAGIMKVAEYAALISKSSTSLSASTLLARFYLDELSVDCPSPELLSISKVKLVKAIFNQNIENYNALASRARANGLKNHKFLNFILQKDELPSVSLSKRFSVSKNQAKNGRFTIPDLTKDEAQSLIGYIEDQFL